MTTNILPFKGPLYRYLSLTKEDKEDLENFSEWSGSNNSIAAWNYINSNAHKRDHRLLYLFKNKKLYRTTPSGFNDPYDCLVEIDNNASDEDLLTWLRRYFRLQAFDPEAWQKQVTRYSKYIENNNNSLENKDRNPLIELIQKTLQKIVNETRTICFSKTGENLLMWAHYADKHEGYCLEFCSETLKSTNKGTNDWIGFYPIEYSKSRPLIKLSNEELVKENGDIKETLSGKILLSKSKHWEYEEEVRQIYQKKTEYFDFLPESLSGIIFGAKMPDLYRTGFQFLLKQLNLNIPTECAQLDLYKYEVNIPSQNSGST